jgi:hypothetical protein
VKRRLASDNHDIDPELAQALWEAGKAAAKHLGLGEPEYMTICGGGVSMQEEKTINWRAMTPEQRDDVMHEKVMGHARKTATHTSKTRAGDTFSYNVTSWQTGRPDTPHYSQSLDAAWVLWPKLAEGDDGTAFVRQCKFMCAWTEDDDVEHYDWRAYNAYRPFLEIGDMSTVTPERICIAMLRAFDYNVLTEEVQP